MTAWYYSDEQRNRLGPVRADDLAELHAGGQLQPGTLVWREGLADWRPWREVIGEILGAAHPPMASASFATATAGAPADASANPYAPAERSPYAPPGAALDTGWRAQDEHEVVYAGFWKRVAAYLLDALVMSLVAWVAQIVVLGLFFGISAAEVGDPQALLAGAGVAGLLVGMFVVPVALQAVYYAALHSSARQATLGKMAIGIKVVDESGGRISFLRGIGRFFAAFLSAMILGIGYLMAAFTDRKRALHDLLASTLVVDQWAYTGHPERQRHELGTATKVILALGALAVLGYLAIMVLAISVAAAA
ncbi:RDD family protein [Lysobacter sp. D1-1-M9]|uniref:RDD family protein n=1 Tax=Novilysobacter longmucuonensis TaxID=3098603 RepID=UPI002FC87D96